MRSEVQWRGRRTEPASSSGSQCQQRATVRATRAQADRVLYKAAIREILEAQENLSIFQSAVDDLLLSDGVVGGVRTQMGLEIVSKKVVLTTGTFLGGKTHRSGAKQRR